MSAIQQLPQEILLTIFELLSRADILQCQIVCRCWYIPVHMLILKDVKIRNSDEAMQFLGSLGDSPGLLITNAVKKIAITNVDKDRSRVFDLASVEKLLFRFPNVEDIELTDCFNLFRQFNDALCENI